MSKRQQHPEVLCPACGTKGRLYLKTIMNSAKKEYVGVYYYVAHWEAERIWCYIGKSLPEGLLPKEEG